MPNHCFCAKVEEIKMGDCNLSSSYNAPNKSEEKLCKYTYCTWCPTCERESPRRRTKSETSEPCRRKGKEMKSPMSRKYDRSLEYENMDLEYETKDASRYDCCRIRSNLCELPTTYITNNYQNVSNLNKMSNGTNDFMDGIDRRNLKFSDILQMQNMADRQKFMWKADDNGKTPNGIKSNANKIDVNKSANVNNAKTPHHSENRVSPHRNGIIITGPEYSRRFCGVNTALLHRSSPVHNEIPNVDLKHHNMSTMSDSHFSNTKKNLEKRNGYSDYKLNSPNVRNNNLEMHQEKNGASFDNVLFTDKKIDNANFQEKYTKEIDILRGKLRQLRGANYVEVTSKTLGPTPMPPFGERIKESCISKPNYKITLGLENFNKQQTSPSQPPSMAHQNLPPATPKLLPMKMPLTIRPALTIKSPSEIKSQTDKPAITSVDNGDVKNKSDIEAKKNKLKMTLRAEREIKSTSKVSLKTRSKASLVRLRKVKHKITRNQPTLDDSESDYSGSDESEAEECIDEASVSEDSVKEVQAKPRVPVTVIHHLEAGDGFGWPLRKSLFPNIPPYIRFNLYSATAPYKLPNGRRYLKWKLSTITPIVVRKTLLNTGFRLVRKSNEWLGTWGKHMKSPMFQTLKETQKLNHFPGTFQLGRKDRLWRNIQRLICKFGYKEFGFIPQTYILPQELKLLKQNWEYKNGSGDEKWIIKPPASARGVGIRVINRWSQLPKRMALVVQKYISNPYLINGSKFDLRLYVLVTSFNPLRVYLYPDGLARFASAKYSDDVKDLSDRYMHLTNYSINKMSSTYTSNEDANACQGHKWTIMKLWEYMEKQGVNTRAIWRKLEQLVIKTIISGEGAITQLCEENMMSRYNCYELFGIDVLLDESLKAWLLEVNISPSLHSASPLDAHVKGPLVKALFDMAQFHLPPQLVCYDNTAGCFEPKLYTTALTKKERSKHIYYTQLESREEYLMDILDELTGDDIRHLTQAEDELTVAGKFKRIFPTAHSHVYLQYMEPRYYNRLFDAWESQFDRNRQPGIKLLQSLCAQKVHLKVASQSAVHKNLPNMNAKDMKVDDLITATKEQQDFIMQKISNAIPTIKETPVDLITVAQN